MKEKERPKIEWPTLAHMKALQELTGFLITNVEIEEKPDRLVVRMTENSFAGFNKETRRKMEIDKAVEGWRWAAGGAGLILRLKNGSAALLTLLRDSGAPTYGGHLTLPTGLSCKVEEMLDPSLMFRETAEEFVIQTKDGIIYPEFRENIFPELNFRAIAHNGSDLRKETKGLSLVPADISFLQDLKDEKKVETVFKDHSHISRTKGLLQFDPGTIGIDFLTIAEMKVQADGWRDLKIYDGEVSGGNILDRDVVALELDPVTLRPTGNVVGAWKSGKFIESAGRDYPNTPVLKCILKSLGGR